MRSTFDELEKALSELKALLASIVPVNSVLEAHQESLVQQYVSIRRRFDYAAFAVVLYASFETFVENLVAAYARLVARRFQYADLPQKLVKKHLSRTAEILSRARIGEGRYAGIREIDIVKNLFECLNGTTPYSLNDAAIVAHDSNLRAGEIDTLFAAVGIEQMCSLVRRADALQAWYCISNELAIPPTGGVPATTVEERLKDIVERRNQVAHRGGSPVDLPGVDAMEGALRFIEAFSQSVFSIAVGRYLEGHHDSSGDGILLQFREGPYENGTIVVVEKPSQRLFVGQPVFVVPTTGARWGRIQSLKVDDVACEAVDVDTVAANGVGIAVDFKCPKDASLIALAVDDDVVWSRPKENESPAA